MGWLLPYDELGLPGESRQVVEVSDGSRDDASAAAL
jgi:hypothetical protein